MQTGSLALRTWPGLRGRRNISGFTYLWLLLAMAIVSVSVLAAGAWWHTAGQRERERELIYRGEQIARALAAFHAAPGITPARWPRDLMEVVEDKRGPVARHHLRQPYTDPYAVDGQWALIKDERGGIMGVHSTSTARAFIRRDTDEGAGLSVAAQAPQPPSDAALVAPAKTVADHIFLAQPALATERAAPAAASPPGVPRPPSLFDDSLSPG